MKILLLSCSTGGGHNSCARYIEEELKENNIECEFKDFYDIVNEKAKNLSEKIYLKSLGNEGKIFKNIYKMGELYSKTGIKSPVYLINKLHKKKLYNYIKNNNIDLVITTHLFPALALTAINKDKDYENIHFLFVATDYEPCPFMEEAKPDYFITNSELVERFNKKKIPTDKLLTTGIPVSTRFIKAAKDIRKELNINNENVILIMLGSMGFGSIDTVIHELLTEKNTKIIVICGTNKELYKRLNDIKNNNLIVLGFVNNINDLLYSSDIVLSKPGGLSSTEVASMRKPLLHIFPIPGIETYNTKFFNKRNMNMICNNKEEIISNCKYLLNNKDKQEEIISNQEKYINNNSAKDLVTFIKNTY